MFQTVQLASDLSECPRLARGIVTIFAKNPKPFNLFFPGLPPKAAGRDFLEVGF